VPSCRRKAVTVSGPRAKPATNSRVSEQYLFGAAIAATAGGPPKNEQDQHGEPRRRSAVEPLTPGGLHSELLLRHRQQPVPLCAPGSRDGQYRDPDRWCNANDCGSLHDRGSRSATAGVSSDWSNTGSTRHHAHASRCWPGSRGRHAGAVALTVPCSELILIADSRPLFERELGRVDTAWRIFHGAGENPHG
jgi:hypothetical protein